MRNKKRFLIILFTSIILLVLIRSLFYYSQKDNLYNSKINEKMMIEVAPEKGCKIKEEKNTFTLTTKYKDTVVVFSNQLSPFKETGAYKNIVGYRGGKEIWKRNSTDGEGFQPDADCSPDGFVLYEYRVYKAGDSSSEKINSNGTYTYDTMWKSTNGSFYDVEDGKDAIFKNVKGQIYNDGPSGWKNGDGHVLIKKSISKKNSDDEYFINLVLN